MDINEQLLVDLKEAMKLRDEVRLTTLRLLKSALKNYEIEVGHDLTLQETMGVLQKEAKKRQDAIGQYRQADRDDLVEEEQAELDVINDYLPEQMSEGEVEKLVVEAIQQINATTTADMGRVIATAKDMSKGRADSALIARITKEQLSK